MTITDIKNDVYFLAGTTSAAYPNADLIRNVNQHYQDVARVIWENADGWQYDDSNNTTLPVAIADLIHNQQDYSLPSTCQRLERVEIKDSSGNYQKLLQLDIYDITNIAMSEYHETPGMPLRYDLIGRSLMFYPTPSSAYATMTSGLKVWFDRDVTEFATTASSETPGFATPFHRILSYATALDFVQDEKQRQFLILQRSRLEQGLVRFYSKRNVERRSAIRPAGKRTWRQYT